MTFSQNQSCNSRNGVFWQRKLAALLHDPPSKCLNLGEHEDWSARAMSAAGLDTANYPRLPDWEASAADRIPFPKSRPAAVSCVFDGVKAGFHHPLGGMDQKPCVLHFERELTGLDQLEGQDSTVQPVLDDAAMASWSQEEVDRARFFAHWRLWRQWAREKDWRFSFLPADTRIPDHTIWHHMQVTSAFAGCAVSEDPAVPLRPAFLKMQIGPVQDFIAAARSIRDLWSGSYMLSWLMAAGLKRLSELTGPDSVLFPNLWSQPLFDLHWRDSLWTQVAVSNHPNARKCWDAITPSDAALLTPNLPNVFLALVPGDDAETLAQEVEDAIRGEFRKIADNVWGACQEKGLCADERMISEKERRKRFDTQISEFPSISWQVTPWPEDLKGCLELASGKSEKMPSAIALERIKTVRTMAEELLAAEHRDSRYYHNSGKPDYKVSDPVELKSRGLAWSVVLAHNAWELDGARQLRDFRGKAGSPAPGTPNNKDSLTGREEAVAGGSVWQQRIKGTGEWKHLFKHEGDWIGAATLIKRLWHLTYLKRQWDLPTGPGEFPMPNLRSLAAGKPFGNDDVDEPSAGENYFAVLAFDGDEIGKWVSGEKTPPFRTQLADYKDSSNTQRQGIREYFERDPKFDKFLATSRPLSPSYHLQFSEALGDFALHCANAIVQGHNGRLVYCGGDDVLAILPAETALECAADLNRAFTGQAPIKSRTPRLKEKDPVEDGILSAKAEGFLVASNLCDDDNRPIPFVVPGPAASASVGIAIAHFKSPLQDVVRAAQSAEKRAKNKLGRSSVAVTLCKRSGEIAEWGCQWCSGGLELYTRIAELLENGKLSSKFPHRVCQLLEPHVTQRSGLSKLEDAIIDTDMAKELIRREFTFAAERQGSRAVAEDLGEPLATYLDGILAARGNQEKNSSPPDGSPFQELLTSLVGLCTTVAFAHRTRSESNPPTGN